METDLLPPARQPRERRHLYGRKPPVPGRRQQGRGDRRHQPVQHIWGNTNADGYNRIDPFESAFRDVRIFQPGVPTDQSPNFYHFNPNDPTKRYSFETHWLYVIDETTVTADPTAPVYHYDLVNGLNDSNYNEPPGASSDAFSLVTWAPQFFQTFVVPPGVNRIVTAKAWPVDTEDFKYIASIHRDNGGPITSWPQVGPSVISRHHAPHDFKPVAVNWALHDVVVTPGQRYALKVLPQDNMGCNAYATKNDTYPQGQLYIDGTPVPGRDLCAVVVGVGYAGEPSLARSPAVINRTIPEGSGMSSNSFTVSNAGTGTLSFSITDNASWISVSPTSGTAAAGEQKVINITYSNTHLLSPGNYTGTITITGAPPAVNSPQTVVVNLTVESPSVRADIDKDNDVDITDFGLLQRCLTGEGIPQNLPACQNARLDQDDDVDQDDIAILIGCLSGSGVPYNPNCAN
jgi:hypothetical protein